MALQDRLKKIFRKGMFVGAAALSVANPSFAKDADKAPPQDITSSLRQIEKRAETQSQIYTRINVINEILGKIKDPKLKSDIEIAQMRLNLLGNRMADQKISTENEIKINNLLGVTITSLNSAKYEASFAYIKAVEQLCRQ